MKFEMRKWLAIGMSAAVIAGCGHSNASSAKRLNPVIGSVSFNDKSINVQSADGAIVQFHPMSGESNDQMISGRVIDGTFSIFTEESGEKIVGSPEGEYWVTIALSIPMNSSDALIPSKFGDPKTSGIHVTIEKGANRIEPIVLER